MNEHGELLVEDVEKGEDTQAALIGAVLRSFQIPAPLPRGEDDTPAGESPLRRAYGSFRDWDIIRSSSGI